METATYRSRKRPFGWLVIVLTLCGLLAALLLIIGDRVDDLSRRMASWIGVAKAYDQQAVYESCLLTASPDSFFRFTSGYGRNSLADMRIKFPDGAVFKLQNISPEAAEFYASDKSTIPDSEKGIDITSYIRGFNSFCFKGNKLWGITLKGTSAVRIDFGDGEFVGLPVPREKVLEVMGPPISWERTARGMP